MRRHSILKLAGRLENPSERYSVGWQEWMGRAIRAQQQATPSFGAFVDEIFDRTRDEAGWRPIEGWEEIRTERSDLCAMRLWEDGRVVVTVNAATGGPGIAIDAPTNDAHGIDLALAEAIRRYDQEYGRVTH